MSIREILVKANACLDAVEWAKDIGSLKEAWETCQRADWMLWGLAKIGYKNDKDLRLFACACVRGTPLADGRKVWDLLTDERSREAVNVAERYAEGNATERERAAAGAAAWAAAGDARAAAEYAAWAARAVAEAAARNAARAAEAAARNTALASMADIVRSHYPKAPAIRDVRKSSG